MKRIEKLVLVGGVLVAVAAGPAAGDTLDLDIGSRSIIEDGGSSIRQFPFLYTKEQRDP